MIRAFLLFACLASPALANGYGVGDTIEDPMQIARDAITGFNFEEEGRPGITIDVTRDDQHRIVIVVARTGLADDSLEGERLRYVVDRNTGGTWTIVQSSLEYRCWRGQNRDWQDSLCP